MRQHINSSATIRATYSKPVFFNQTSNPTLGYCSNVNCHFQKAATPTWGTPTLYSYTNATTNDCDQCHGDGISLAAPQDGSHPNTTNKHGLYYGSTVAVCAKCHADHTAETNKFAHATSAGNRALILQGTSFPATATYSKAADLAYPAYLTTAAANRNGTCTNLYCHSQGTGGTNQADGRAVSAAAIAPTWGGTVTCASCHTGGTTTGPTYVNNTLKANMHASHTKAGVAYTCDVCHFNVTSNGTAITNYSKHANGFYNISANTTKTPAFRYTFAASGGTCSNTACHGSGAPSWGTAMAPASGNDCQKCHGSQTAGFTSFSGASIAPGANNIDTARVTGVTTRGGVHQSHLSSTAGINSPIHCGECHTTITSITMAPHLQYSSARINFGPLATTAGKTPVVTRVGGAIQCANTYCHTANRPAGSAAGQAGTGSSVVPAFNTTLLDNTTVSGTCLNKCHGLPPGGGLSGDSHSALLASGSYTTPASLAACSSNAPATGCHPSINAAPTSMATIFKDNTLHIDGKVEGGSCTGCHASTQGKRVAAAAQFTGAGNSHHFQSTTAIDGKTCYACHWEADSTGSPTAWHKNGVSGSPVALVVWSSATTRPTTASAATLQYYSSGGASASSRGAIAKINRVCLGCHSAKNATTQPFSAGGDTNTPVKYAWDGLSIGARYSQTGTTPWGKFSGNDTNNKSTQAKAYSAHGNAVNNQMGWSTAADTFPSSKATSNVMCFDCHNSHGSTTAAVANAITSSYSSATGRRKGGILKDTTAGLGGYTMTYKPAAATPSALNPYSSGAGLCFDCHMTATSTTLPWGYSGTFGFALPAGQTAGTGVSGYFDTPYFGTGTFAQTVTYPYKAAHGTNLGGHLKASSGLSTAITKRPFDPATPTGTVIQGLCTPCHDPHGVSPSLTTNQQYGVPLLKGTWVTSPYKQDSAPANTNEARGGSSQGPAALSVGSTPNYFLDQRALQAASTGKPTTAKYWNFLTSATSLQTTNDTQFAGLCTGCHAKAVLNSTAAASSSNWKTMTRIHNSVKGWASTGGGNAGNVKHAYTCSKCHTPHNSRLPRLLVTNCLDAKHRGRLASGGVAPVSHSQSGSSGAGSGRFPAGGGGATGRSSATNPGPWFFGVSNGTSNSVPAVKSCHDSATAGGATFSTGAELWNTKSPW
ncbi:MAG: CxxxxCH/CxxCH domain-containing protein [Geobacteraceae bacterium]|nr:CxxxxCH/CxxCH domain-containing protein [Geobacteraceae bacterium]